jgi:hypothetical protein
MVASATCQSVVPRRLLADAFYGYPGYSFVINLLAHKPPSFSSSLICVQPSAPLLVQGWHLVGDIPPITSLVAVCIRPFRRFRAFAEARNLQSVKLRHRASGESLEIAVHTGGPTHQQFQATVEFRPVLGECALLSFEIALHEAARLDNGRDAITKERTRQVLVDQFRFFDFGLRDNLRHRRLDQRLP